MYPLVNNISKSNDKTQAVLKRKRTVRVFQPTKGCPLRLTLTQLVVYSYHAYQDEYKRQPDKKLVGAALGLSYRTIQRADQELTSIGLLDCNLIPNPPPLGYFQACQRQDTTKHWRHSLTSWDLFIRSKDCGLSPLSVAVWSFVTHCVMTRWQPRDGLGASYLAHVLFAGRQTIQEILTSLEDARLVTRQAGMWCPVVNDFRWLADKWDGTKSKRTYPTWATLPDGETPYIPTAGHPIPDRDTTIKELIGQIDDVPSAYSLEQKQSIHQVIINSDQWQKRYYDVYLDLSVFVENQPTERWSLADKWVRQNLTPLDKIGHPLGQNRTPPWTKSDTYHGQNRTQ